MGFRIDLTGQKFGKLTVMSFADMDRERRSLWVCKCECGNIHVVKSNSLKTNHTKSCGCANHRNYRHGMKNTPLYQAWKGMKTRCQNPNNPKYKDYGGRGIKVCDKWQIFQGFLEDMGPTHKPGLSIDRIDNDGNYEPGNCRWATRIEQQSNTRKNRFITYKGKTRTIAQWSRELNIKYQVLYSRLTLSDWPPEKAFRK